MGVLCDTKARGLKQGSSKLSSNISHEAEERSRMFDCSILDDNNDTLGHQLITASESTNGTCCHTDHHC